MPDVSAIRKLAWETRRAKYGPSGHGCGAYTARAYREIMTRQSARFDVCDAHPRMFIRHLRAILEWNDGDPEFELSEGMATALLAEREKRAVDRALTQEDSPNA